MERAEGTPAADSAREPAPASVPPPAAAPSANPVGPAPAPPAPPPAPVAGAAPEPAAAPPVASPAPTPDATAAAAAVEAPRLSVAEMDGLVSRFGKVINTGTVYGAAHKLTQAAVVDGYKFLGPLFDKVRRVNIGIVEGLLHVDGNPIDVKAPLANVLSGKMQSLKITGFSLVRGLSADEFEALIRLFVMLPASSPVGAFGEAVDAEGMEHVEAERLAFVRVSEEDGDAPPTGMSGDGGDSGPNQTVIVEQILAFLKGDVQADPTAVSDALRQVATDAEKLAELIMEATMVRQRAGGVESGESLADLVVGCLRRTFEGLRKHPSAATQEGRRTIRKALLLLEKNVLDKLHAMMGEADPGVDQAIAAAVQEMEEELEVASVATEYVRRRDALVKSQKRVLRHMLSRPENREEGGPLQAQLMEAGLPLDDWRELAVRAETPEDKKARLGGVSSAQGELGVLAALLTQLDGFMKADQGKTHEAGEVIAHIGEQVGKLADATMKKIEALGEEMGTSPEGGRRKRAARRGQHTELLAEIVQELCQPVSAVNCAIGMIAQGYGGDLSLEQLELLGIAVDCGRRLDNLLHRLREIVGMPTSLIPQKEMIDGPAEPILPEAPDGGSAKAGSDT